MPETTEIPEETVEAGPILRTARIPVRLWLLIALLVIGLAAAFGALSTRGSVAVKGSARTFQDPEAGFAFTYPRDWRKLSPDELDGFQDAFVFGVKRAKPEALVGVRIQPMAAGEASLDQVLTIMDETMPQRFQGFKKESSEKVRLSSGEEALQYDYTFMADGKTAIRQRLLIVPTGKRVFYVTAWARAGDFKQVAADLNAITTTFRVN